MSTDDPGDLDRFVAAQDRGATYDTAVQELNQGRKQSHWMWFVFPQLDGLGTSAMARRYAISNLEEARAYLDHPVLGARLRECAEILDGITDRSADQIFGGIDAMKLHSSMTLFHRADPTDDLFARVLQRYFDGRPDAATDRLLKR